MYSATRLNQFNNKLNPCCRTPSTTRVVELLTPTIWLESYISLAHRYWYVAMWEIWGDPTCDWLYTIKWKLRLRYYESVTKQLYILRAIWLAKKSHNRIYHIIIYLWDKVIHMWSVMVFSRILTLQNIS